MICYDSEDQSILKIATRCFHHFEGRTTKPTYRNQNKVLKNYTIDTEMKILWILVFSICIPNALTSRILIAILFNAKSHFPMFDVLASGLAARGHEVDLLSHFSPKKLTASLRHFNLSGTLVDWIDQVDVEQSKEWTTTGLTTLEIEEGYDSCKTLFGSPIIQGILKSKSNYDLVISEAFEIDCFAALSYRFKCPLISVITSVPMSNTLERVGNPEPLSYIPNYYMPYTSKMSFIERVHNVAVDMFAKFMYHYIGYPRIDEVLREHLSPDAPPLNSILKNTSLLLVNSHFSINQPRPLLPSVVEVGGLHIQEPEELPKELKHWLDESSAGVVYFSLGTMVRSDSFSADRIQALVDTFSSLPQRVLWKVDATALPPLPPNVRTGKWLPQLSILNHPNVHVFITHGGLMGTQEAIWTGVPMLGIPMFGDQRLNLKKSVDLGVALILEYDDISRERFSNSLNEILKNKSFRENAQQVSRRFKDRPMTPLDTAIFWTEYVIRNGGAPHWKSEAADMPFYQYFLLDVVAFIISILALSVCTIYILISKSMSILKGKPKLSKAKTKSGKLASKKNK